MLKELFQLSFLYIANISEINESENLLVDLKIRRVIIELKQDSQEENINFTKILHLSYIYKNLIRNQLFLLNHLNLMFFHKPLM